MCGESPYHAEVCQNGGIGMATVLQTTQKDVGINVCPIPVNAPLEDCRLPRPRPSEGDDIQRTPGPGDHPHYEEPVPANGCLLRGSP